MVHSTRKLQQLQGQDGKFALLQMDLKTTFNLVSRPSFLLQFKELLTTEKPSFGIGITSAVTTSAAAFLGSLSLTRALCSILLPANASAYFSADTAALESYNIWKNMCAGSGPTFSEIDTEDSVKRQGLTECVQTHVREEIPEGDQGTKAFRDQLSLPRAKDWLKCQPSPGLRTYMRDRDFGIFLQNFYRIPLFNPGTPCPGSNCKEVLDVYGDHLLYCKCGGQRNWRRECQVRLVGHDLSKAARRPIVEECPTGPHNQRPDIRTPGTAGETDLLDVTIIHLLSAS